MTQTVSAADRIPAIGHAEAMRLAQTENARLLAQLRDLDSEQWAADTDCTGWTVRDVAVHLVASAQAQASPLEFVRQVLTGRRLTTEIGGAHWVDGLNEAQLRARTDWAPAALPIGTGLGVHIGWQPLGYLVDVGFTRDVWMHRIDIARAAGSPPELSPEHDGRLVADIVAEWSRRHGRPYELTLTGPAGGRFRSGTGGEPQTVDAVEFVRILSGRAEGPGILRHKLPL